MDHEFNVNFGAAIVEITLLFPLSRNVYMSLFAASHWQCRPVVIVHLCQHSTSTKQKSFFKGFSGRRQWPCDHSEPLKSQPCVFTCINLPVEDLNKNKYLEKDC